MVRKPISFSLASWGAMTDVSGEGAVSDQGRDESSPRQNAENNLVTSAVEVGFPHNFSACSLYNARQ